MANSVIPTPVQTWTEAVQDVTQNGVQIGTLVVWYNKISKLMIARWSGNGNTPTAGTVTVNLPSDCVPKYAVGAPLRNGDQIEVSNSNGVGVAKIFLLNKYWSSGFVSTVLL